MTTNNDLKRNASACYDPTPYQAIHNIEKNKNVRLYKLLHTIFHVCELAGFEVQGHITLLDRKTGKIYY